VQDADVSSSQPLVHFCNSKIQNKGAFREGGEALFKYAALSDNVERYCGGGKLFLNRS
jgi:hypothetical protein